MADTYFDQLRSAVPTELLDRLLALPVPVPDDALTDPDVGPVARALIVLWYCGTWSRLPDDWRQRNGALAGDVTGVVSSAAYQSGLQWTVIGAHPAGARQQGYGSWSLEPAVIV